MKYIFTIQRKSILESIEQEGVYFPDLAKSIGTESDGYQLVLQSFNNNNKSNYKGVVFAFAKYGKENYFESIEELYQYFMDSRNIVKTNSHMLNEDYIILQLAFPNSLNMIPVDFCDFSMIMNYKTEEGNKRIINTIVGRIEKGIYKDAYIYKDASEDEQQKNQSFTQVHVPFIKKENIVGVYGNFDYINSFEQGKICTFPIE